MYNQKRKRKSREEIYREDLRSVSMQGLVKYAKFLEYNFFLRGAYHLAGLFNSTRYGARARAAKNLLDQRKQKESGLNELTI